MRHQILLPLHLSVKNNTWRMNDAQHGQTSPDFEIIRSKILQRDDYTCRGCNFRSPASKSGASYQEVHHIDNNHRNNNPANLATLCGFCHQCFHIGFAGISRGGTLIWMPEISQANLNNLTRSLFIAMSTGSEFKSTANKIYQEQLLSRAQYLESALGDGTSNPAYLGDAILEGLPADSELFNNLRLLPYPEKFQSAISHWAEFAYVGNTPENWLNLLNQG